MQEVENVYHTFLHRQADPTGVTAWTQFLERCHTLEQLQVQIVTSPEYFQDRANSNPDLLLATLITDAYNRPISPADRDMFGGDADSGRGRGQIADQIFATNEWVSRWVLPAQRSNTNLRRGVRP
jgi:hypothetical protein